jgi:GGDEF domain-containing protein
MDSGIEFANNGILDSLTGAPAQSVFMTQLRQAISRTDRSGEKLCILTFKFNDGKNATENLDLTKSTSALISISQILNTSLRGGDFFTRMSQLGFWVCLHGGSSFYF